MVRFVHGLIRIYRLRYEVSEDLVCELRNADLKLDRPELIAVRVIVPRHLRARIRLARW